MPFVLWFTGLPCSGKTTLANALQKALATSGITAEHLDGDVIRKKYPVPMGFTKKDRVSHGERVVSIVSSLQEEGQAVIVSLVSPYRETREHARKTLKGFIEIYLRCPLAVCEERDVKGLYRSARKGEIVYFTGISDPYEEPKKAEIVLDTDQLTVKECVSKIVNYLERYGSSRTK